MRISDWSSDVCSSDRPVDAGRAIPAPFAQWVAAFEKIARDGRGMGIAPRVSRRCVVADKANDLLAARPGVLGRFRSEEHTSELQSLMRISDAVFCLKKQTYSLLTLVPMISHHLSCRRPFPSDSS